MKKSPSPQVLYSSPVKLKLKSDCQSTRKFHHKTASALSYILCAAKKVTGVFRVFLPRKRQATFNGTVNDDANERNIQVKQLSYSTDQYSTGSYTKNSTKYKTSDSYASSGSISGKVATVNLSFEEIYKATEKFSAANKVGEGGFGTVYKGKLKDGSIVAVKRAKKNKYDRHVLREFKNEILTLSKIEHLNLVKLFGYLEQGDEKIIVVEYVGNGNLREHLDGQRGNVLETAERLDIAIDVAHALTYLHTYSDPPIIHRDIKASNILITEKLRGKVADFGFARMAEDDPAATHISTQVKGTAGYLDPEYLRTYQLTEKSDVYSFGVLLVEMMTGRYPIEPNKPLKERVTIRWAIHNLKQGDAILVMDPRLKRTPASTMAVEKILKLAHDCLVPSRQSRPTMKKCAEVLWAIRREFREISLSSSCSSSAASTSYHSSQYPFRDARKNRHPFGIEDDDSYKFISA